MKNMSFYALKPLKLLKNNKKNIVFITIASTQLQKYYHSNRWLQVKIIFKLNIKDIYFMQLPQAQV